MSKDSEAGRGSNFLVLTLLIVILVGAGVLLLPVYRNYRMQQEKLLKIRQENKELRDLLLIRKAEENALRNSPEAIEKVAREKFDMTKDGEKVYIFDQPGKK